MYLVDGLKQQQFAKAVVMLAAYTYLNVATPAADCFEQLRRVGRNNFSPPADHFNLRTFAVAPLLWLEGEKLSVARRRIALRLMLAAMAIDAIRNPTSAFPRQAG